MMCGICKLGIRAGENPGRVRVVAEDFTAEALEKIPALRGEVPGPGLYSACPQCIEAVKPAIAARTPVEWDTQYVVPKVTKVGKPVEELTAHDLI